MGVKTFSESDSVSPSGAAVIAANIHGSRICHQDQQAIAAAMSSRVNEALHRLSSPLRRAEYILACEGHAGEETDKLDDMELLMEVMEAREGLANAQSPEDVAEIREENDGVYHFA